MTRETLISEIKRKKSYLCVGLDTDIDKIPKHLLDVEDPIFEFNKQIIEATLPYAVAYKPNLAFYESMGYRGWMSLKKTLEIIPDNVFTIADAKRGDIGNTASMYAKAFFGKNGADFNFDSITIAPYMGKDSVKPFLEFEGKWGILLGLTSNEGSNDFQQLELTQGGKLFEEVISISKEWGTPENMMYVIGATRGQDISKCRSLVPDHFFLVPGVGAQGGSLEEVSKYGFNSDIGVLVNSSRGIIYASEEEDFAVKAGENAKMLQLEMEKQLLLANLINE